MPTEPPASTIRSDVEPAGHHMDSHVFLPHEVFRRDFTILKDEFGGGRAPHAYFFELSRYREAGKIFSTIKALIPFAPGRGQFWHR